MGSKKSYWAVDFDGTLCVNKFPLIGAPIQSSIDMVKDAHSRDICIIIWTCRDGVYIDKMKTWLKDNGVPYDYINENPECDFTKSPKIYADLYIDDRAYNPIDYK